MASIKRVLIVGAGIAGLTLAGELQHQNIEVRVVELEPEPVFRGIGIALLAPALRSMQAIGLLDACIERGVPHYVFRSCTADGTLLATTPLQGLLGSEYPPAIGIPRPALGDLLYKRAADAGVDLRFGVSVSELRNEADSVEVGFSDGTHGRFDLVVGADGLRSAVRAMVFPEEPPPTYLGQHAWRLRVGHRPEDLDSQVIFLGEKTRAGLNPILPDDMYIYIVHQIGEDQPRMTPKQSLSRFLDLLGEYGGSGKYVRFLEEAAQQLTAESPSHYGPLYTTFMDKAWYRGRVLLIGDAAHATPPHLASGAAIAIEDALVLARAMRRYEVLGDVLKTFMDERYERCRMVIQTSRQLASWDMDPSADKRQAAALTTETWKALADPI